MQRSLSDPRFRLKVLEAVLKRKYQNGICIIIMDVLEDESGEEYYKFLNSTGLDLFPELNKHKPKDSFAFWFPVGNRKDRTKILQLAISELKQIIENENRKAL